MLQKRECFCYFKARGFKIDVFLLKMLENWCLLVLSRAFFGSGAENARTWVPFGAWKLKMLQHGVRKIEHELFEPVKFRPYFLKIQAWN